MDPSNEMRNFAVIHEEMVSWFKARLDSPELNIPESEKRKALSVMYLFYGYGGEVVKGPNKTQGELFEFSLCKAIVQELDANGYTFEGFHRDEDGNPKFTTQQLYKAKNAYNRGRQIEMSDVYYDAFLFLLGYQTMEELVAASKLNTLPTKIDPTKTGKSPRKPRDPENYPDMSTIQIPARTRNRARISFVGSRWFLYSLNKEKEMVIKAVVTIGAINENGEAPVTFKNPPHFHFYEGKLFIQYSRDSILLFHLYTKNAHKKIYFMSHGSSNEENLGIMLGIMSTFSYEYAPYAQTVLFVRIPDDDDEPMPMAYLNNDPDLAPDIRKFFFDSPGKFVHIQLPKFIFTKDLFSDWVLHDKLPGEIN